jgi:copper chaperone CopZ
MEERKLALGGSLFSAIAGSLCCIGPFVAVLLGASDFVAAGFFVKWRLPFLSVSAMMLAVAYFLTYRRPKADGCSRIRCTSMSVAKWNKVVLWLATALVIVIAAFPTFSGPVARLFEPESVHAVGRSAVSLCTLELKIPSMECEACAVGIQTMLKKQDGIPLAQINYATRRAIIYFDPTKLSPERIMALIDASGFKAESTVLLADIIKQNKPVPSNIDRMSIFQVPLRCPAAPEIACGSRSKPLLLELERTPGIAEAWLNYTGTLLAVVGSETSTREERTKAVQIVFRAQGVTPKQLEGQARLEALKDFRADNKWVRGGQAMDDLSSREAGIVGARLLRRLQAKVTVRADKAKMFEAALSESFKRQFVRDADQPAQAVRSQGCEDLLAIARDYLDEKGVAAFKEAFDAGYLPQPEEK